MPIDDLWVKKDGTRSKRYGRGLRYRVRVDGYKATSHRTRKEAEYVNAQRLAAGPPKPKEVITVSDLLDQLLASKQGLSRGGYGALKSGADHARLTWGDLHPADLEAWRVEKWLAELQASTGRKDHSLKPASAETKAKALRALKGAVEIAARGGLIDKNPIKGVTVTRRNKRDPRFLRVEQLKHLAECMPGYETMIMVMGTAGPRIGEVCAFNVEDVDARRGRLRVRRSKSGRARDVPVPASLMERLDVSRGGAEPLFLTPMGKRVRVDNWRHRVFNPGCIKAGLPGLVPHDLRHTAASLMIASGASVKDVQAVLGHASAKITLDLYAGLFDERLDDVSARMDGLL